MYSFRCLQHAVSKTVFSRRSRDITRKSKFLYFFTEMWSFTCLQPAESKTVVLGSLEIWIKNQHFLWNFTQLYSFKYLRHLFSPQFGCMQRKSTFLMRFNSNVEFHVLRAWVMKNYVFEAIKRYEAKIDVSCSNLLKWILSV